MNSRREHRPRQGGRSRFAAPNREQRFDARAGQLPDPVIADVFQEQVSEGDMGDAVGNGIVDAATHASLVFFV
jgi:hypothetical protein